MRYDQSIECTGTAFWCTTQHSTSVHVKWTTRLAPSRIRFRDYTSAHECPLVVRKRVVRSKKGLGPVTWSWRGKKLHERRQRRQAPRWGHSSAGRVDRNERRAICRLRRSPDDWHGRATNPRVNNNPIEHDACFCPTVRIVAYQCDPFFCWLLSYLKRQRTNKIEMFSPHLKLRVFSCVFD